MSTVSRHAKKGTPIEHRITNFLSREHFLTKGRVKQYGVHPLCVRCPLECDHPQYNAPNSSFTCFTCAEYAAAKYSPA